VRLRGLAIGWTVVAVVFLVLVLFEVAKWRSLVTEAARAGAERQRLTAEIQLREQQLVAEMRRHATLLRELQWTTPGGDPSAFLTRLAELARERRMKVMGIGPLESQATPQFTKSWHSIDIRGPYREIRELAARVERDRGILEDFRLEAVPASPGGSSPADDVQARFRMAALELSAQARQIVERAQAASGGSAPGTPGTPLALSVPTRPAPSGSPGRDPFVFLSSPGAPARPPSGQAAGPAPSPPKPEVPLEVRGIVAFPDGFLAIVNNQIVKVGDTVSGHRVERITEGSVILREPGTNARTIELPDVLGPAPAPPRR